jgi:FlaA1/EpsC-like NDP-sugar epimerase
LSSLFRQNIPRATLFQLGVELSWLFVAILLVLRLDGRVAAPYSELALLAFIFAFSITCLNGAFGLYRRSRELSRKAYFLRVVLAPAIGIPLAYFIAQLIPTAVPLYANWVLALLLVLLGLLLVRHVIVLPLVAALLPHRILVLGTGPEARLVEASLTSANPLGVRLVGFYALGSALEGVIAPSRIVARGGRLDETVRQLHIDEVIIAVRQQRGGVLPLRELLDCRLSGITITDLAGYFERVHGQVPIESLKVSWLIYGQGFRQNLMRVLVKRVFDLVVSAFLIVLTLPLALLAGLLIALE